MTANTIIHSNVLFAGEATSSTDKNLELNKVATPTDENADGGGLTLKGTTDKTFNWLNATDAWNSSENISLAQGKSLILNGATSGSVSITPPSEAGSTVLTLPSGTGTLVTTTGTVAKATNVVGGTTNQLLYQSAVDQTAFVPAPSQSTTYLQWTGSAFAWTEVSVPVERTFVIAMRDQAVNITAISGALTVYGRDSNIDVTLSL